MNIAIGCVHDISDDTDGRCEIFGNMYNCRTCGLFTTVWEERKIEVLQDQRDGLPQTDETKRD